MEPEPKGIDSISEVDINGVFPHEERDFTPWLKENLWRLDQFLESDIVASEKEVRTGDFRADLVCTDRDGDLVVIENQIYKTDHDHLGKLITYLAAHKAKTAIWITSHARNEHSDAVNWLNENSGDDTSFYLFKIRVLVIGDSNYGIEFVKIVGPNIVNKPKSEVRKTFLEFNKKLLSQQDDTFPTIFKDLVPKESQYTIGKYPVRSPGAFVYCIQKDNFYVQYEFKGNKESIAEYYNSLYTHKKEIDRIFNNKLEWIEEENSKFKKIRLTVSEYGGWGHPEKWDGQTIPNANMEMSNLYIGLKPYIDQIKFIVSPIK